MPGAAVVGANLVTSLLSAKVIQYLWGIINSLQLIVLTVLFSVKMPETCYETLKYIMQMTNLDTIDTTYAFNAMFNFRETAPFNEEFDAAGYNSTNFFIESGALFFLVCTFIFWVPIRKLL